MATRLYQFTARVTLHAQGVVASGKAAATSDFGPCFTFTNAAPESTLGHGSGGDDGLRADCVGVDFVESTARHFSAYGSIADLVERAA